MKFFLRFLIILIPLTACAPPVAAPVQESVSLDAPRPEGEVPHAGAATPRGPDPLDSITIPISIYILDDESGLRSSVRTEEEIREIYVRVNEIWRQASIEVEVRTIARVSASPAVLDTIVDMDFPTFFEAANRVLEIPSPSPINGFYAKDIGGPNGIAPFGARLFFVMDTPSVYDERVSAHEIGHILGLHHTLTDSGRLLFPGTNGMALTPEEISVARYNAAVLLGTNE